MGSKPSHSDYQPSEADKANASVAMAEYNFAKKHYEPLIQKAAQDSQSGATAKLARGRANADTMQALTGQDAMNPELVGNPDIGRTRTEAIGAQLGAAGTAAKEADNNAGLGALNAARSRQFTAQNGLATVSRIKTTEALARARDKMTDTQSKLELATQLGSAFIGQGIKNNKGGGTFLTPNISNSPDGVQLASGLKERITRRPST